MDKEFLSRNITRLRKERGWSQEKLAQEAEVSYHTVFRAEAGTKPRTDNLQKIAKALNVSETALLYGDKIPQLVDEKSSLLTSLYSIAPSLPEDKLREVVNLALRYSK